MNMLRTLFILVLPGLITSYTPHEYGLAGGFLRNVMSSMRKDLDQDYYDFPGNSLEEQELLQQLSEAYPERVAKEPHTAQGGSSLDYLAMNPMLRDQEYLQHSSLWGHQSMAGGAGEGKQHLSPSGQLNNSPEVKTDAVLPAYCNPPNPCPLGYTAEQGCLEEFENTAAFSNDYQAAQDCMCDTEHMFECPSSNRDSQLDAIARSMQNEGISAQDLGNLVNNIKIPTHKGLVAKKFHVTKVKNPFLRGEKLPTIAKKGNKA